MSRIIGIMSVLLLWNGGCADSEEVASDPRLDPDVQFLEFTDSDGNRYELPYKADLTPAQMAADLDFSGFDDDGHEIQLTAVLPKEKVDDDVTPPDTDELAVWPLERVDDGEAPKRYINSIANYRACWSNQSISSAGSSRWYTIYNAFSLDGFIDPSNDSVDFDLYLYIGGSLLCSSLGLGGFVDSCGAYNSGAYNQTWDFRVRRWNSTSGTYRLCAYYDRAF